MFRPPLPLGKSSGPLPLQRMVTLCSKSELKAFISDFPSLEQCITLFASEDHCQSVTMRMQEFEPENPWYLFTGYDLGC